MLCAYAIENSCSRHYPGCQVSPNRGPLIHRPPSLESTQTGLVFSDAHLCAQPLQTFHAHPCSNPKGSQYVTMLPLVGYHQREVSLSPSVACGHWSFPGAF